MHIHVYTHAGHTHAYVMHIHAHRQDTHAHTYMTHTAIHAWTHTNACMDTHMHRCTIPSGSEAPRDSGEQRPGRLSPAHMRQTPE